VELRLLSQPYRESLFTGQTFITNALEDEGVTRFTAVTAWVRQSGMRLLTPSLEALKERGGTARLVFGVDLHGTSRQGVELAREHFTDLYVTHDPSGRTFHPKVYYAAGSEVGYALVGSNNLTAGGLWHNYETATTLVFDPRRDSILDDLDSYVARVLSDEAICKLVNDEVFQRLVDDGWLTDEATDRRRSEDRPATTPPPPGAGPPLFTPSQVEKRDRPAPVGGDPARRRLTSRKSRRLATAPDSWWKPLGAGDAQHPEVGNPTGNVALTNTPPGQDRTRFFREVFFGKEDWRRVTVDGKRSELATITAAVEFADEQLGTYSFELVFRQYRMSRGRATTVLRWGDLLEELKRRDVTDWYLLIERGDAGMYRLRFTPTEPA
jgi:hypothetical protein